MRQKGVRSAILTRYPYALSEYGWQLHRLEELSEEEVRVLIPRYEAVPEFKSEPDKVANFIRACDFYAHCFAGSGLAKMADMPEIRNVTQSLASALRGFHTIEAANPGWFANICEWSGYGKGNPVTLSGLDALLAFLTAEKTPDQQGKRKSPRHSEQDRSIFLHELWNSFPKDGPDRGRITRFTYCVDPLLNRVDSRGRIWKVETKSAVARARRRGWCGK